MRQVHVHATVPYIFISQMTRLLFAMLNRTIFPLLAAPSSGLRIVHFSGFTLYTFPNREQLFLVVSVHTLAITPARPSPFPLDSMTILETTEVSFRITSSHPL